MSAAAGTAPPPEWYLARDGEQFGPLSDSELRKLVEFGHLKPSDLLWREGFPDWRSAKILLEDKSLLGRAAPAPAAVEEPAATNVANAAAPKEPVPSPAAAPVPAPSPQPVQAAAPVAAPAGHAVVHPAAQQVVAQQAAPTQRATSYAHAAAQAAQQQAAQQQQAGHQQAVARGSGAPAGSMASAPVARGAAAQPQHPAYPQALGYPGGQPGLQPGQPMAAQPAHTMAQHGQFNHASMQHAGPMHGGPMHGGPMHAGPAHTAHPQPGPMSVSQVPARPVEMARPAAAAPVATATRHASAAPVHRADDDDYEDKEEGSRAVVWIKRIAVLIFFCLTLAAAAWYAYPFRDRILNAINLSALSGPGGTSPIVGFKSTAEATDAAFQATPLWQVLKRDFPEWYGERVKEASSLAQTQKSEAEIGKAMVEAMVALRRKHAGDALSATTPRLKSLATAFAENLVRLRQVSVEACHTFISTGETSPEYLRLLADPAHSRPLQTQLIAVFEAIADGRKIPRIYPQPKQADYNLLVTALEARGWTETDMQLFSDSRRFGQAEPEKVCTMVTDWFQAQIDLKEPDAQLRLLADALKPVVAG